MGGSFKARRSLLPGVGEAAIVPERDARLRALASACRARRIFAPHADFGIV